MPSGKYGERFFERLVVLEQKVADLMRWQKWQMGVLAAILIAIIVRKM